MYVSWRRQCCPRPHMSQTSPHSAAMPSARRSDGTIPVAETVETGARAVRGCLPACLPAARRTRTLLPATMPRCRDLRAREGYILAGVRASHQHPVLGARQTALIA